MLAVFFHNQHVCPSCYLSELCIDMVQDSLEKNDRILTNFDVWTRHLNELQNAFFLIKSSLWLWKFCSRVINEYERLFVRLPFWLVAMNSSYLWTCALISSCSKIIVGVYFGLRLVVSIRWIFYIFYGLSSLIDKIICESIR